MAFPGHLALVTSATGTILTGSGSYSTINGIKNLQIQDSRDLLDITDFNDVNVHARLAALRDVKVTISGDYENFGTTTAGWNNIAAAFAAGNNCALQMFLSASCSGFAQTQGFAYTFLVESIAYNAAVDGKVEISVALAIDASSGTPILVMNGTAPN